MMKAETSMISAAQAAQLCGVPIGAIGRYARLGKLTVGRTVPRHGRPQKYYRRDEVERLAVQLADERAREAEHKRELLRGVEASTAKYVPLAEREEPVVLYGLLTRSDVAELERRRAKVRVRRAA